MKRQTFLLRQQAGATLLEVLAFIGVASLIIVGAVAMFRSAQSSAQANKLVTQISGLRSSIRTLTASQARFGTATYPATGTFYPNGLNAALIAAKTLPDTLRVSGSNIYNAFGGQVYIDGSASDYWVVYTNVPQAACLKAAVQTGRSWQGIRIGVNLEYETDVYGFPFALAAYVCGTNNTVIWRGR